MEHESYVSRRIHKVFLVANAKHLEILKQGKAIWKRWRAENLTITPDFVEANLRGADLNEALLSGAKLWNADLRGASLAGADLRKAFLPESNLEGANLSEADLSEATLSRVNLRQGNLSKAKLTGTKLFGANLFETNLVEADLSGADLSETDLRTAKLKGATLYYINLRKTNLGGMDLREVKFSGGNFTEANLHGANLSGALLQDANFLGADLSKTDLTKATLSWTELRNAKLSGANLSGAYLTFARLIGTNLADANLAGCRVYGISAWNLDLDGANQSNLIITPGDEPTITVDNLELAQFIYLLLNNEKIRDVIDTIGKKTVLILGRFTPERKAVLDTIRDALRHYGYLPILFDFERPSTRDTQETIVTLAGMVRFVIADITDPKSIPQELASIVPTLPSVPVQPLLQTGYQPWGMYDHIKRYPWVLPLVVYEHQQALLTEIEPNVIARAEAKAKEQTRR